MRLFGKKKKNAKKRSSTTTNDKQLEDKRITPPIFHEVKRVEIIPSKLSQQSTNVFKKKKKKMNETLSGSTEEFPSFEAGGTRSPTGVEAFPTNNLSKNDNTIQSESKEVNPLDDMAKVEEKQRNAIQPVIQTYQDNSKQSAFSDRAFDILDNAPPLTPRENPKPKKKPVHTISIPSKISIKQERNTPSTSKVTTRTAETSDSPHDETQRVPKSRKDPKHISTLKNSAEQEPNKKLSETKVAILGNDLNSSKEKGTITKLPETKVATQGNDVKNSTHKGTGKKLPETEAVLRGDDLKNSNEKGTGKKMPGSEVVTDSDVVIHSPVRERIAKSRQNITPGVPDAPIDLTEYSDTDNDDDAEPVVEKPDRKPISCAQLKKTSSSPSSSSKQAEFVGFVEDADQAYKEMIQKSQNPMKKLSYKVFGASRTARWYS